MAYATYSHNFTAEVHAIVEAKQKTIAFEVDSFKPEAIAKRIIKEFDKLHNVGADAGSGELEIVQQGGKFDSVALFKKAKEVSTYIEPKCHVKAVAIRGESGAKESFEVKFSFYDNPIVYRYRHLEF